MGVNSEISARDAGGSILSEDTLVREEGSSVLTVREIKRHRLRSQDGSSSSNFRVVMTRLAK
ncbi:hypothetical protein X777_11345 [Ooceraea biroi]|uniref:Uncharacterized protein n=1 Tax=Ooceraea biroi TaxID=2015173 RepID=A0A026WY76_OOCBI|nr:hypothetical protein X777_11345 [Ooceraea biroi]